MPPRSLGQRFILKALDREAAELQKQQFPRAALWVCFEEIDPLTGPHTG